MTKQEFDSREGAGENDQYVIIGNEAQLSIADDEARGGCWNTAGIKMFGNLAGLARKSARIQYIVNERMNNGITQNGKMDTFINASERLAYSIIHETGHRIFRDHPKQDAGGHVC
jgi:hypothetical protein